MIYAVIDTNVLVSAKLTKSHKNLKNPSADVFALRAFVLTSWLCACERAPAPALTSALANLQNSCNSWLKRMKSLQISQAFRIFAG